jgi:Rrf2 family protein
MHLSKTSALAALATAYLAHHPDTVVQARQVAAHLNIPTDSALKILQVLSRQRLIRSHLGRSGGYQLARAPELVSVLEIVEAIDGPIDSGTPLHAPAPELLSGLDHLQTLCREVAQQARQRLGAATVADLAGPTPVAEPLLAVSAA